MTAHSCEFFVNNFSHHIICCIISHDAISSPQFRNAFVIVLCKKTCDKKDIIKCSAFCVFSQLFFTIISKDEEHE